MTNAIKIGTRDVDFTKALPLTLRDIKKLKAEGLDILKMSELDSDQLVTFIGYVAKKADPKVTDDDVLDTPMWSLAAIAKMVQEPDADFLASSTSLGGSTAGEKTSLKH